MIQIAGGSFHVNNFAARFLQNLLELYVRGEAHLTRANEQDGKILDGQKTQKRFPC